jgi:hypothetical protein
MNCPSFRGQRLLSSSNPVALFSAVDARKPDVAFEPLTVVAGFATDAVAAVSVVGRDGRIYTTPSEHNVFFTTRLPRMGALEIRATDVFGRRVWGVRLARIFRGAPTRDGR